MTDRLQTAREELRERVAGRCCLACGAAGAQLVQVDRFWSFLLHCATARVEDYLCRRCGVRKARRELVRTALLGWWGLPWGAATPLYLARQLHALARIGGSPKVALRHLPIALLVPLAALAGYLGLQAAARRGPAADSYAQGLAHFRAGRHALAVPLLEQAVKRRPTAQARLLLARALISDGRPEPAVPLLAGLLERELDPDLLRLLVVALAELGRGDEALRWAGRGLARWPAAPALLLQRGRLLALLGDPQRALADYEAAASRDGEALRAWCQLGGLLGRRDALLERVRALPQGAARTLALAELMRDPARRLAQLARVSTPAALLAQARLLDRLGRDGELRQVLQRLLDTRPAPRERAAGCLLRARLAARSAGEDPEPWLAEGRRSGAPPLAVELERARICRSRADWAGAEQRYQALLERHRAAPLTRVRIARLQAAAWREQGGVKLERAAALLEQVCRSLPAPHHEHWRARRDAVELALERNRTAEARAMTEAALAAKNPFVEIRRRLALYRALVDHLDERPRAARGLLARLGRSAVEQSTADPYPVLAARFLTGQLSERQLAEAGRRLGPHTANLERLLLGLAYPTRRIGPGKRRDFPYHLLLHLQRKR